MDFALIFSIIAPVTLLVALGAGSRRLGVFNDTVETGLIAFITKLAIPLLLFRIVYTGDLPPSPPWTLWLGYFAGVAVVYPLGMAAMQLLFKREQAVGVIGGVSAGFANTVLVGIPVVSAAYGEAGLLILSLLLVVHLPIMVLISTLLMSGGKEGERQSWYAPFVSTAKTLAKNTLVMGLVFGFLTRISGIVLPGPFMTVLDWLADAAIPCALVALGMSVARYGVKGNVAPVLILSALKLMLMPLVVFIATRYLLPLPVLHANVMILTAAAPTGINAYLIAGYFGTGLRISASTITVTTAASFVTLSFWVAIVKML